MMDYQEGCCDGLAGAGAQERGGYYYWEDSYYGEGFLDGSLDRKAMLASDAFARWADGLMDATAGDVMQPVQLCLWADGMGDGNG
jgi:hypothetical protein